MHFVLKFTNGVADDWACVFFRRVLRILSRLSFVGECSKFQPLEHINSASYFKLYISISFLQDFDELYFGTDDALDINVHLFYMIMDQLARYTYYYGCYNGSSAVKGQTRASPATCTNNTNECFANYPNVSFSSSVSSQANINAFLTAGNLSGGCQSRTKGHTDLAATDLDGSGHYNSSQVSALCKGVVLMNNLRTVLSAISSSLSNVPGFDSLSTISDLFSTAEGYGNTAGISDVMSTLSQTKCEADFGANDNGKDKLAVFFVLFFETLFV